MIENKKQDDKKPLLVKNAENETSETTSVISQNKPTREVASSTLETLLKGTTARGGKILEFLRENGAKISGDKFIVNGVTHSLTKMNTLLVGLCHGLTAKSTLKSDPSMLNLLTFIKSKKPASDMFPSSVNQFLAKQKGSGLKRRQNRKKSAWIQKKMQEHKMKKLTRKMQRWTPF